jgi:sugar/nucleoside kinase (ribokinase family)
MFVEPGHTPPTEPGAGQPSHPDVAVPEQAGEQLLAAAARLARLGPPVVVVTEGEHGSWCVSPEGSFHVPAFPVQPLVDTTGAGDVFHGAFLYGRAHGWDLRRALRLAAAVAAMKCRAIGGRAGIPTLEEALILVDGPDPVPAGPGAGTRAIPA